MDIQTMLRPGKYHPVYCEDHLYYEHLSNDWFIGAVMDGCSSGKDSHFASALYVKSLQKACRKLLHAENARGKAGRLTGDHEALGRHILFNLFEDIKRTHKEMMLDIAELLSTILLLVYRKGDRSAWINVAGDGLIVHDGERIEVDQHNMPDYQAYHIDMPVENWFNHHTQTFSFQHTQDMTISTDGLLNLYQNPLEKTSVKDPIAFLLDKESASSEKVTLVYRLMQLVNAHNCIPYDDIAAIRILP